ncbi:YgdI/YgdR family lipoprotein [Pseudomonas monteilii]|uniref:YgdI/YgdR family lipoprotein n=1 Tax=Pseudomonas TaxID=286 RepID=UPI0015E33B06|nr:MULTISPECIES: YgdI/YgdR family lipoprotein [Pseudomonas]ELS0924916.1 YgdI/YgdR family lipoprotein [Pseudomonas putida]MBA1316152.1 YgdI/YgdR family lipoprotein [Pseudomonas monteilii]QUN67061.1 YgdI/YgdR family lipoprotein [Pseudomonas sp. JS425]
MKKSLLVTCAISFGLLAGCSTPSLIVLNDGKEIQTLSTPRYDQKTGFYEFKQPDGKLQRLNKEQVRTIKDL